LKEWDPALSISNEVRNAVLALTRSRRRIREISDKEDSWVGGSGLYPFQRVGSEWLMEIRRGILGDEQGMGKTVTSLDAASRENLARGLVVCTNTKRDDWVDHIREWTPYHADIIQGDRNSIIREKWDEFLVCNYTVAEMHYGELASSDMLIADEAHRIRNRKTKAFKALLKIAGKSKPVHLLTASPNINTGMDSWTLLHICDPERFRSFWSFAYRFCEVKHNGFGIKVGGIKETEEENLSLIMADYLISRPKSLLEGMPKVKARVVKYEMPEDQRAIYNMMRDDHKISLDGIEIEAEIKIARMTRLRQLALHPRLLIPEYRGSSKIDPLVDVIQEKDTQAVVFTDFARLVKMIVDDLREAGITAAPLIGSGSMTSTQQRKSQASFKSGESQVLVATHGTGGEGLNLVEADRVIFIDLDWHPPGNKHAQDRISRPGQMAEKVESIAIKAVDTIEDDIWDIVRDKRPVTIDELIRREHAST